MLCLIYILLVKIEAVFRQHLQCDAVGHAKVRESGANELPELPEVAATSVSSAAVKLDSVNFSCTLSTQNPAFPCYTAAVIFFL